MIRNNITNYNMVHADDTGSNVSRRFEYQLACAFMTLLSLSDTTDCLTVILERGDDFVIVENFNENDEKISFVQVKTRAKGPFTLRMVLRGEWIKKQAKNYLNFLDDAVKNILLTNFGVEIDDRLVDGTSLTQISKLPEGDEKQLLIDQIESVISSNGTIDDFYLLKSTLSLDAYVSQLKGELMDYVNSHVTGGLNSEAIDTIFKTIWDLLREKQSYILNDEEKTNYETIIDKKGFELSRVKAVIKIAKQIDIPDKSAISAFYSSDKFNIGGSPTILAFLSDYKKFRSQSHMATALLEECWKTIEENDEVLNTSRTALDYSLATLSLLDGNPSIVESNFYQEHKLSICAMFTYKAFRE